MPRPNFFIVGAPKCGTTSMYMYLREHPEVFMPNQKEVGHFASDLNLNPTYFYKDRDRYLSLFAEAGGTKRLGEATVWYLYSQIAASEIKAFNPESKIIVMLRNPADMLFSIHGQFLWAAIENIADFEAALAAEPDRRAGRRIPKGCSLPKGLLYSDVIDYAPQLQRYFDAFGRDNVHVILFDDFKADVAREYQKTLMFLGVDDRQTPDFRIYNPAKPVKARFVKRLLFINPKLGNSLLKVIPHAVRRKVFDTLAIVTGSRKRSKTLSPKLPKHLLQQYQPKIKQLEILLGRDLSIWFDEPDVRPGAATK